MVDILVYVWSLRLRFQICQSGAEYVKVGT